MQVHSPTLQQGLIEAHDQRQLCYCRRPIGRLGFVALNLASLPLVFGHLGVTLVAGSIVVGILAWYARPERATGTERAAGP